MKPIIVRHLRPHVIITQWSVFLTRLTPSFHFNPHATCMMTKSTTVLCAAIGFILFADLATSYYKFYKPSTTDAIIERIKKSTRTDYNAVTRHIFTVHTGYWIASLCNADGALIMETGPSVCELDALSELESLTLTF
jgi:hypothetical protein